MKRLPALALLLMLIASCSSGSKPKDQVADGIHEATEAIPEALGRSGFAIDADEAIIGGGASQGEITPGITPDFAASREVWLLQGGSVSELPRLPADGFVEGLSGVRVGDWIVLGGIDCETSSGATTGLLGCGGRLTRVLWTKTDADEEWQRHVVDEVMEPVEGNLTPMGMTYAGDQVRIVGSHDDGALVAFMDQERTRFARFDPASGDINEIGEAPTTLSTIASQPFCANAEGQILHVRAHVTESEDRAAGSLADQFHVARLSADGTWDAGAPIKVGDLSRRISISTLDIECPLDRDPLVAVSLDRSGDSRQYTIDDDPPESFRVEAVPPILASVSQQSLEVTVAEGITNSLASEAEQLAKWHQDDDPESDDYIGTEFLHVHLAVEGTTPDGELIIRSRAGLLEPRTVAGGDRLYTVDESGGLSGLDHFETLNPSATKVLVYSGVVGTVVFHTGSIRVHPLGQ